MGQVPDIQGMNQAPFPTNVMHQAVFGNIQHGMGHLHSGPPAQLHYGMAPFPSVNMNL